MKPPRLTSRKVYDAPEGYVTMLQLRDWLNKQPEAALTGPALFSHLDEYGSETLLPVEIILDTWNDTDTPRTVHYNRSSEEYSRFDPNDHKDSDERPLGQLPRYSPLLAFSAMEENDLSPRNKWLKQHLQQPAPREVVAAAPAVPSPAPLFEQCPLPTKEAVATALQARYGGRPIEAAEIVDVRDFTEEGDADQTIHFQAWRNAMVDWYEATVNSAGHIDHTSIQQLPF
jgi:hypothetical protein